MRNRVKSRQQNIVQEPESLNEGLAQEAEQDLAAEGRDDDFSAEDESWLDDLTPYEAQPLQPPQEAHTPPTHGQAEEGTPQQQERLKALYRELEHVDEEVAVELHDKVISPELDKVRAEVAELRRYREQERAAQQSATLAATNNKILAKYPKAGTILRSKEFMDFVNADNNPYATDTEFNILLRAYHSGGADYVIEKLDKFVSSRGKPKPPVGVEPQQGGGRSGVSDTKEGKRPMTDEEYLAKRRAIKTAPKGAYPPNALKNLVNEYMNSRG